MAQHADEKNLAEMCHPQRLLRALVLALGLGLAGVTAAMAESGNRLYVQQDTTAYRETTSLSTPVAALEAGREVVGIGRWASWVRVRFGPAETEVGWVVAQKLASAPPPAAAPKADGERAEGFVLKVSADQTTRLRVVCEVVGGTDGGEERRFDAETPTEIRFPSAQAVSCELRDREHVEAKGLYAELLSGSSSLARAQTDAIYQRALRLRSDGPWGRARAQACRARAYIGGQTVFGTGFAVECRDF